MAIITISRGTYSGAKSIAEQLARRLDYPCISQEQIFDATREFGIPETELNAALIKPPSTLRMSSAKRIAILNAVRAALLKSSRDGNAVYHGFAGHLLLGGVYHILRVRVIASMEYRIHAAMKRHNETSDQALSRIRVRDKQSIYWSRYLYGVDWQDPSLYDVVLNLERISIQGAVETLILMSELNEFKPDGMQQQAFDDVFLGSMVWAELHRDPRTRPADVRVEAKNGHVIITGNAHNEQMVHDITDVAQRTEGVTAVTCEVGVGSHWLW
jgi:cytidylate kinase